MKKISTAKRYAIRRTHSLVASTGSHCPANGIWLPEGMPGQGVFVFEGSIMPVSPTGATVWLLADTASGPDYPLPGQAPAQQAAP